MLITLILIVIAYLMGSICSAIPVCKMMGLPDPRSEGSKNPGTTNVLRIGGKKAAIITLAGDSIKGLIPVLIAHAFAVTGLELALVGLAAFLGHLFPVFFRFEGGKGVATGFGVVFAISWPLGLVTGGIWIAMAFLFRYSSLAALSAFAALPAVCYFTRWNGLAVWQAYALPMLVLSALLIWRHKGNIEKLRAGSESKLGQKKNAA